MVYSYMYIHDLTWSNAPQLRLCNYLSQLAYLIVSHTHPVACNQPRKTLVAKQQQTSTYTCMVSGVTIVLMKVCEPENACAIQCACALSQEKGRLYICFQRKCWISATEQFQRKPHKFFDLRCPLGT